MTTTRIICNECDWHGEEVEALTAPNPFVIGDVIRACPNCKTIDQFAPCCEHAGCGRHASAGTPTPEGYAQTCYEHRPT
jgi:hypothetical protein